VHWSRHVTRAEEPTFSWIFGTGEDPNPPRRLS
jgi:hypothetical protein